MSSLKTVMLPIYRKKNCEKTGKKIKMRQNRTKQDKICQNQTKQIGNNKKRVTIFTVYETPIR
jgi:hypothetical protein